MKKEICVFWFRRDLRLNDNHGLFRALTSGLPVLPLFIFDTDILERLQDRYDRRVDFIAKTLENIKLQLSAIDSDVLIEHGKPLEVWKKIFEVYDVKTIYSNHDYEKYASIRDEKVKSLASENGVSFHSFKDQAIFEKQEILSGSGTPYTVFTPYSRKWKETLSSNHYKAYESDKYFANFLKIKFNTNLNIENLGFEPTDISSLIPSFNHEIIENYKAERDFPSRPGTTRISIHLRFGTVSIRQAVVAALGRSEAWLNELVWRDFYFNILSNFPHISDGHAFRQAYDRIQWRSSEEDFNRWCLGNTGFAIVDAGMRELNTTGFMHNRVRMIVASFFCKDLLLDWRLGEAYFAQKLNDFDFSANNGGWQWASGSGCDAAPYFRVFNPDSQTLKFDKDFIYIKKWVPEFNELSYRPMLNHSEARLRALKVYGEGLK
ncbi:MAG: cryptochrome/photolyase family protein [Leadbetterella sp.]